MVDVQKSSFVVWVAVTEVTQQGVEVRAESQEEATRLVTEVMEGDARRRCGIEYLKTSKGVMGFDFQYHDHGDVSVEVEDVETLHDEDSALLEDEIIVKLEGLCE